MEERPAFGRSYQTPFADRIRCEVAADAGVAVIGGAIASSDDVNSILLAGRADLCAVGRTHLYDPQWTLHAAVRRHCLAPRGSGPTSSRRAAASRRPPAPTPCDRGRRCCARSRKNGAYQVDAFATPAP